MLFSGIAYFAATTAVSRRPPNHYTLSVKRSHRRALSMTSRLANYWLWLSKWRRGGCYRHQGPVVVSLTHVDGAGITGKVSIDENGDRNADYSLLDLNPETGLFEVSSPVISYRRGAWFTKCLTTILGLSYDNAKLTIDLRRTSNDNLYLPDQWEPVVMKNNKS